LALAAVLGCTPDEFKGVTIRYMAWGNPQQLALEKRFCEEFSVTHPGVRVRFIQTPSSAYLNKMVLMLASRTSPDVMRVDHFNFPALVAKDYFRPLDDLIAADPAYKTSDYFPVAVEEGKYRGRLYGVNVLLGAQVVYYNKDLLRKAGLEDPYALWKRGDWDWATYRRYALAMTQRNVQGKVLSFGSWVNGFASQAAVVYAFGGSLMDPSQSRVVLAEGKAREAFRYLHDLRFVDRAEPTSAQAANAAFNFDGGKLGMSLDWLGSIPRLREAATFDWDVCPLPMRPGGTTMVKGNQLAMASSSEHPKEAWAFMKYMTGRETEHKLYVELRRCFPSRKDVAYGPDYLDPKGKSPAHLDAFVASIEGGRVLPITSRWSEWNSEFNSGLEPLFNGTTHDVDAALREAQRRANATLVVREGL
jgi:multiple sugar transport system substrate-binding protein